MSIQLKGRFDSKQRAFLNQLGERGIMEIGRICMSYLCAADTNNINEMRAIRDRAKNIGSKYGQDAQRYVDARLADADRMYA